MGVRQILGQWTAAVKDLLVGLHGHQIKGLAHFSLAMVQAGHCHSGKIAAVAPCLHEQLPASQQRRWERLIANGRIDASVALRQMSSMLVKDWDGRKLLLVLDETPKGRDLRSLRLGVACRKRLIPMLAECYPTDRPPLPMDQLICRLLREAADLLPESVHVILLCDRGLAWPQVMDCVRDLGWDHVMRLQHSTRVRIQEPSGQWREQFVADLAPVRGCRWHGPAAIFKKAGWRWAKLTVLWDPRSREPWALAACEQATGGLAMALAYAKRNWCEQSFRDEKSSGFHWQKSKVRQPDRVMRVVLVMALAMLLALSAGVWLIKRGQRHVLDPHGRRRLSVFQLGRRWLIHQTGKDPPGDALPRVLPLLRPP